MKNSFGITLFGTSLVLALSLLLSSSVPVVQAQSESDRPATYDYEEPVVFNEWCQQIKDMYGPTCVCNTTFGTSNNIDALDLDHIVNCDPIRGDETCIDGVTIETARVWLKASSIGEVGNYETIQQTVIKDFYVFLDDTSIDTVSFRYNAEFANRRSGCQAFFGGIKCARCGLCDTPENNRTDEINVHLSPNDIFNGISGQCRYGNGPNIGIFNTCEDGDNVLTNIVWRDLEVTSEDQVGACATNATAVPGAPSSATTTLSTVWFAVAAGVAALLAL